jgi:gluconokinase
VATDTRGSSAEALRRSAATERAIVSDYSSETSSDQRSGVRRVVVMGVSGSGKSTIGRELADRIRGVFIDGDDLHPDINRSRMAAGVPLTDDDRQPWLRQVGSALANGDGPGGPVIVACSALRRIYRDLLREHAGGQIVFVHLAGAPDLLAQRMSARRDHFMPPALLASQLATLEPLAEDETGVVLDISSPPLEIVGLALDAFGMPGA